MSSFNPNSTVIVAGGFDNIRAADVRFLDIASHKGKLHVWLFSDQYLQAQNGSNPKFPESERLYFLESLRFVNNVEVIKDLEQSTLYTSLTAINKDNSSLIKWVENEQNQEGQISTFCRMNNLDHEVIPEDVIKNLPASSIEIENSMAKKVLVTGSFDWMHSGHIRFFEEASAFGDLYVVVGHDANIKLLKGEGHPLFNQDERRYLVQCVRFVKEALISSGNGWLDAEPEIRLIKPDYYVVNEDGDKPEKENYCKVNQIEYKVLKRLPKPGLPRRESTALRGF